MPANAPRWWIWLVASALVAVADQISKAAVVSAFQPGEQLALTPFASLVLAYNTGAAFSFLADAAGWQRWLFTAIACAATVLIVWLLRRGGSRLYLLGLALILGGALGNLYDRLTIGTVVDFLLLHYRGFAWPAFNVADSAISVGAALLVADSFRQRHGESAVPAKGS